MSAQQFAIVYEAVRAILDRAAADHPGFQALSLELREAELLSLLPFAAVHFRADCSPLTVKRWLENVGARVVMIGMNADGSGIVHLSVEEGGSA